jgi:hypothetical protein
MRKGSPKSPNRVIAYRVLKEISSGQEIQVSFEEPRKVRQDRWHCRFVIKGLGRRQIRKVERGGDSVQALLLTIEGARVTLDRTGSHYSWVETHPDQADTGLPRFIPMFYGPLVERRIEVAIEREVKRHYRAVLGNRKLSVAALQAEITERRAVLALLEERLEIGKSRAEDWEADLKKWKPKITR